MEAKTSVLIKEMFDYFAQLRDQGTTILLVEQNIELAFKISNRAYIIDQGRIVHRGRADSLLADQAIQEKYRSV